MYSHSGLLGALAAIFLLLPTTPILAQSNSLFENVLQSTINNTIQNEINKPQRSVSNANVATSTRESNQQVQQALNHFGYPVGSADGILGKRSRTGIAKYQKSNGHDATGTLTNAQRSELIASWRRSDSGNTLGTAAVLGTIGTNQTTHQDGGIVTRDRRKGAVIRPTNSAVSSGNIAVTDPNATTLRTPVNPTVKNQKTLRTRRATGTTSVIANDPATNAGRRRQTSRTTTAATPLPATRATTTTDPNAATLRTLVNPTVSNQKTIRTRNATSTTSVIAPDPATNAGSRRQTSRTTTAATPLPATRATTTTANQPALTRNRVLPD